MNIREIEKGVEEIDDDKLVNSYLELSRHIGQMKKTIDSMQRSLNQVKEDNELSADSEEDIEQKSGGLEQEKEKLENLLDTVKAELEERGIDPYTYS